MKKKYEVYLYNELVGTRTSERDYTHAVVYYVGATGDSKVLAFSGSLEKANIECKKHFRYCNGWTSEDYEVTVVPVSIK
jgi:hypothetical protein